MKQLVKDFNRFVNENLEHTETINREIEEPNMSNTAMAFVSESSGVLGYLEKDDKTFFVPASDDEPDDEDYNNEDPNYVAKWYWKYYASFAPKVDAKYIYFVEDDVLLDPDGNVIEGHDDLISELIDTYMS